MTERKYPFDRVMVMGQMDGTWVAVYMRKGFGSQKEAIEDVRKMLGTENLIWEELPEDELEGTFPEETEASEPIQTDVPDFMRDAWRDDEGDNI